MSYQVDQRAKTQNINFITKKNHAKTISHYLHLNVKLCASKHTHVKKSVSPPRQCDAGTPSGTPTPPNTSTIGEVGGSHRGRGRIWIWDKYCISDQLLQGVNICVPVAD